MATAFTHTFVAVSLGKAVFAEKMPLRFWVLSIICSVLPDADVIGFRFGIRYADVLGHRGFTHSLSFALLAGMLAATLAFPALQRFSRRWGVLVLFFFLVTASHGLLDALTNGGYGIAFFSPFDTTRYFFPWQPLEVSPIGVTGFMSLRGLRIVLNEVFWIWVPVLIFLSLLARRRAAARRMRPSMRPK